MVLSPVMQFSEVRAMHRPTILSRLSTRGRVVIPKDARQHLGLKAGDVVRFAVNDRGEVTINRARSGCEGPFVSFDEWASAEDEGLYGRL